MKWLKIVMLVSLKESRKEKKNQFGSIIKPSEYQEMPQ